MPQLTFAGIPATATLSPVNLFLVALRASAGTGAHANAAREVVLLILFAQLLAQAGHDGPPHAQQRAPRHHHPRRDRLPHRDSLAGRRPRG
jgi:hypothetical protein